MGQVCKYFDGVCKKTAPKRKGFTNGFVNFSAEVKISESWHKRGSAYGYIDIDRNERDSQSVYYLKCRILKCNGQASFRSGKYQQNAELIENFKSPKFNEVGDVYSYYVYPAENKVMETVSKNDNCYRPCGLRYIFGQHVYIYNLYDFRDLPDFLLSALNFSFTEEVINGESWKLFNLKDTNVPRHYRSLEELVECLEISAIDHYSELSQQTKKLLHLLPVALKELVRSPQAPVAEYDSLYTTWAQKVKGSHFK